jgi:hypothetical protein
MPDEPKLGAGRNYQMGDVGAGARVAQGENISWTEGLAGLPNGDSLTQQFNALLERIVRGAKLWAAPHFFLAPIRRHGFLALCAAAVHPFRPKPSRA